MLNEIVIVGDSIAVGVGASSGAKCWVNLLGAAKGVYVNNQAISGSHMIKGIAEPTTSWQDQFAKIPTKTDYRKFLIIALGVNDVGFNYTDFTKAQFITDYTALVSNATSKGWSAANIILLNIYYVDTPSVWDDYLSYGIPGAADTARYNDFRSAISVDLASLGIVLDPYTDMAAYGLGCLNDGLHPNDIGHQIIADYLIENITIENMGLNKEGANSRQVALNLYDYKSSTVGDAIGDIREGNISGWEIKQMCTVANATKGSGTWITLEAKQIISLDDSNELEGAGTYVDLVDAKSGVGEIFAGDGTIYAKFTFNSTGVVTLRDNTANVFTTLQTGTDHVIIKDAGTNVRIVNEMGTTLNFLIIINYNS